MSETATMTLTEFLNARLDEDEAAAREAAVAGARWRYAESYGAMQIESDDGTNITRDSEELSDSVQEFAGPHIARHDPARVLADVEAKRAIVDDHGLLDTFGVPSIFGERILGYLAAVYADRPDYDPTWAPTEQERP